MSENKQHHEEQRTQQTGEGGNRGAFVSRATPHSLIRSQINRSFGKGKSTAELQTTAAPLPIFKKVRPADSDFVQNDYFLHETNKVAELAAGLTEPKGTAADFQTFCRGISQVNTGPFTKNGVNLSVQLHKFGVVEREP